MSALTTVTGREGRESRCLCTGCRDQNGAVLVPCRGFGSSRFGELLRGVQWASTHREPPPATARKYPSRTTARTLQPALVQRGEMSVTHDCPGFVEVKSRSSTLDATAWVGSPFVFRTKRTDGRARRSRLKVPRALVAVESSKTGTHGYLLGGVHQIERSSTT